MNVLLPSQQTLQNPLMSAKPKELTMPKKPKTTKLPTISTSTVVTTSSIKDVYSKTNQGITLISKATMQKVYENSGDLAKANEFQTHYWALNFRHKAEDGSILDISIPTVYFNYKQEVSSAAIDFDLKDVKEYSEKLEPVHHMKVNQLLATGIKEQLEEAIGVPLEMQHSDINSIHRHPGSSTSQRFSGTDLTKTATEPGVVFPLASGNETANFAGIMAIDSGTNNVAHYEYRTATGVLGTDIEYTKGRCAAIVIAPDSSISAIERLMGITEVSSYACYDSCSHSPIISKIHGIGRSLYLEHAFEAFTDSVVSDHLTAKAISYGHYYGGYGYSGTTSYSDKYRDFPYRYHSKEELTGLTTMVLNDFHKALTYEDSGSTHSTTWIATATLAHEKILKLQEKLGYTAEKPYGKHPLRNLFKTVIQYQDCFAYDLREEFQKLATYYNYDYTPSEIRHSFDKPGLLSKIERLRQHYLTEVAPKYPEEAAPTTAASSIRPRATLSVDEQLDLKDAIDVVAKYADYQPMTTEDIRTASISGLYMHLADLEESYYDGDDSTIEDSDIYLQDRADYAMQINFMQHMIQSELDHAVATIKELSVDEEAVKALKSKEGTEELTIEFMKEALSLYAVDTTLLKSLTYEKTKELYDLVVCED